MKPLLFTVIGCGAGHVFRREWWPQELSMKIVLHLPFCRHEAPLHLGEELGVVHFLALSFLICFFSLAILAKAALY